jgi:hypothetical protein
MADQMDRSRTGSVLGGLNILLTFSVMTCVSQCKIRNDMAGVILLGEKLGRILEAVFAVLSREAQVSLGTDSNPFVVDLQDRVEKFRSVVGYYGLLSPEKSGFDAAYDRLRNNISDPESIKEFRVALAERFISDVYQTSSDTQEHLVEIFKICSFMSTLLEQEKAPARYASSSQRLYTRLQNYVESFESSLRRGHTVILSDIYVSLCFLSSLIWYASPSTTNPCAPIQTETLGVIRQARKLSANYDNRILLREIHDMSQLYGAIRAREVVSIIFGTYEQGGATFSLRTFSLTSFHSCRVHRPYWVLDFHDFPDTILG